MDHGVSLVTNQSPLVHSRAITLVVPICEFADSLAWILYRHFYAWNSIGCQEGFYHNLDRAHGLEVYFSLFKAFTLNETDQNSRPPLFRSSFILWKFPSLIRKAAV
jgi:hypothetical protein